tara:strand:- start:92 stop:577 length:486 start_codon:yes stop_codon:yes gene_type:complete
MRKILIFISLGILITGCGFKPIYKMSADNMDINSYTIELENRQQLQNVINEELDQNFPPNTDSTHKILLNVSEDLIPLIVNTNGTVAKYRIEITFNFSLKSSAENKVSYVDTARGFAQYSVVTSEIQNEETRSLMTRSAANEAIQMMISKIRSNQSIINDN